MSPGLSVFTDNVDEGTEGTLRQFAEDSELGGRADLLEKVLERDLDRLDHGLSSSG